MKDTQKSAMSKSARSRSARSTSASGKTVGVVTDDGLWTELTAAAEAKFGAPVKKAVS